MTYRGNFKNGVVVFRRRPRLKEGAEVRVVAVGAQGKQRSRGAKRRPAFCPVGTWEGPPGELARLLAEVQQMRESDLAAERAGQNGQISA